MRRPWKIESDEGRHKLLDVSYPARGREKPADAKVRGGRGDFADWWMLDVDGRSVSCLLCFPLEFTLPGGEPAAGFGLGAVSTLPDATRQGHAAWLCGEIGRRQAAEGRPIGLLYSGIPAAYYERLGYRVAPAWEWSTQRLTALSAAAQPAQLTHVDPLAERDALLELYARHHVGLLHLRRDAALHDRTLALNANATWHLCDGGYVRVEADENELEILELIAPPDAVPAILSACAAMTLDLGLPTLCGWMDPSPFAKAWFEPQGREKTLPMVLGAAATPSRFWSSDYF
jgi:hypothetical protein